MYLLSIVKEKKREEEQRPLIRPSMTCFAYIALITYIFSDSRAASRDRTQTCEKRATLRMCVFPCVCMASLEHAAAVGWLDTRK